MNDAKRPPVWQLVLLAVKALGGKTTNVAVRDWILDRHPDINTSTIQCQIIACTVNHDSRVHYPMNGRPRRCDGPHDVAIELKVAHGPDAVCGQLMRYMGWVKRHLANGKPVRGIIIAQHISDKIRYALADVEGVQLKQYEISLHIHDVDRLS